MNHLLCHYIIIVAPALDRHQRPIRCRRLANQIKMEMHPELIVRLGIRWRRAFGKQREFDVTTLLLCVGQQYLIFQVSQADYSVPHLLFEFLNNKDVKIVGVGMEKPLQKPRGDYDLHVNHALDLGILTVEMFAKLELRKVWMNELVMKLLGEQLLTQRKMRVGSTPQL
jgi:hypothetical protein